MTTASVEPRRRASRVRAGTPLTSMMTWLPATARRLSRAAFPEAAYASRHPLPAPWRAHADSLAPSGAVAAVIVDFAPRKVRIMAPFARMIRL